MIDHHSNCSFNLPICQGCILLKVEDNLSQKRWAEHILVSPPVIHHPPPPSHIWGDHAQNFSQAPSLSRDLFIFHRDFSKFTETGERLEGWIGINSSLKSLFFHSTLLLVSKLVPADLTHKSSSSLSLSETKSDEGNFVSLRNTHVVIVKFSQTILMGPSSGSREWRHHFNFVSSRTETWKG